MRELLETHLLGQYITPMTWDNCLNTKRELVLLLRGWVQLTNSDTIGNLNNNIGVTPLIRLQIGDIRYQLNHDTRRNGVIEFLENERNDPPPPWITGNTGRVSNAPNGEHIPNLQMYSI